jgi:hypothetical protein
VQDVANGLLFLAFDASDYMRRGTGDRRRHDRRHETSGKLTLTDLRTGALSASAKCELSGSSQMNISMGNSAKIALLRSCVALMH